MENYVENNGPVTFLKYFDRPLPTRIQLKNWSYYPTRDRFLYLFEDTARWNGYFHPYAELTSC